MSTQPPLIPKPRPRALDLFCGAGGATMGLMRAGFHVTGVDINNQPRYVGDCFRIADATRYPLDGFDFIWASPPCQAYSVASRRHRGEGKVYADLVAVTRDRLKESLIPYVIENVPFSPLRVDLVLCGSVFGLDVVRHRCFEFGYPFFSLLPSCSHPKFPVTVCGDGTPSWARKKRFANGLKDFTQDEKRKAMGIDWMNRRELSQSIPPAYAEYIGRHAMEHIRATRTAA